MAVSPTVRSTRAVLWPWVAAAAVIVPLLLVLIVGLGRDPRAIPSPLVGRQAPDFILPLFDHGTLDTATLRGKVVVVNFWASWCVPACSDEAPDLQRVWDQYRDRGVVVVGVDIQDHEPPALAFINRFGQTFPNGMDPTGKISIDYGVYGVPETFVIDQRGRIVFKQAGAITDDLLITQLTPMLRGRADAP